jgi:LysR family transcriptional regulator, transcriptional activator of the cysJI operon
LAGGKGSVAKLPGINPQSLFVFYSVAEQKSLSSAAQQLFLTQPGVTYHIRSLEEYTRVKLINIHKQRVTLTPAGEGLFKYAKVIYQNLLDTERFIDSLKVSSLGIGLAPVFISVVGPILDLFEKHHTEVKLVIKSGDAFEIVRDVLESKLDLAIVPKAEYGLGNLQYLTICSSKKLVCFASTHMAIPEEPLDWSDLSDYPLIIGTETSVIRKIVLNKFQEEGLAIPYIAAEVSSTEWIKRLVENGKGLGFILTEDIEKEISKGSLRIIQLKPELYITADVVMRTDLPGNPIISEFVALAQKSFPATGSVNSVTEIAS